jgi:hypothetical protein
MSMPVRTVVVRMTMVVAVLMIMGMNMLMIVWTNRATYRHRAAPRSCGLPI